MKSILVAFFFLVSLSSFSQTVIPNYSDNGYNNNGYNNNGYRSRGNQNNNNLKNCFSINPAGIFIGDYPLYYERKIVQHFHIQGGIGLTGTNYLYNIFGSNTLTADSTIYDPNFNRTATMGQTYMVQPKLYIGKNAFQGFYIGIEYRYRKYNYTSTEYDNISLNQTVKEYRKVTDILLMFGGSHIIGNHLNIQYYIGFGPRTNSFYYASSPSQGNQYQYGLSASYYGTVFYTLLNQNVITFSSGFRIGFAF
jgi:hypothetical protein